jgi:hypothetical protein
MVSGRPLVAPTLSEARSNYLEGVFTLRTAYYDNLFPGYGAQPISDVTYWIAPSIKFDKSTPRLHQIWTYRPSFILYQHTNERNEVDQGAALDIEYRWSPHITVSGHEIFQKSSNIFNQPFSFSSEPISGAPPSSPAIAIPPFASQLSNTASAQVTYQFSANETIGASGTGTIFNYPNPTEALGFYNSNSRGASIFYNRHFTHGQSLGMTYQYVMVLGEPAVGQIEIQTHTVSVFYTTSLGEGLSLTVSAGPQHYAYAQPSLPESSSLAPSVTASVGWQGARASLAANYSHTVTLGAGQLGALSSNTASISANWQLARTWSIASVARYAQYNDVTPLSVSLSQGGQTILGSASLDHSLTDHLIAQLGYQRLHQKYGGVAAITANPDTNSAFISISYKLSKPLGR